MSDYDMSIHTNPDAMAWTKFFREINPDCNVPDDVMFGWFANAMMAMHDHLLGEEAIERVARAYCRSYDIDPDFPHGLKPGAKLSWEVEAPHIREAISAAMGEPK